MFFGLKNLNCAAGNVTSVLQKRSTILVILLWFLSLAQRDGGGGTKKAQTRSSKFLFVHINTLYYFALATLLKQGNARAFSRKKDHPCPTRAKSKYNVFRIFSAANHMRGVFTAT